MREVTRREGRETPLTVERLTSPYQGEVRPFPVDFEFTPISGPGVKPARSFGGSWV